MRVVVLGAKGLPDADGAGGVERGVAQLGARLSARGHDVVVYARGQKFSSRSMAGVRIREVPFVSTRRLAGWSHLLVSLVDVLLHERRVDVYHVHCAQHGVFCIPLRLTGARMVFHLHGCEWRARKWGRVMAVLIWVSGWLGVRVAHVTAAVCRESIDALAGRSRSRARCSYVPNGVPNELRQQCSREERDPALPQRFLLYAGRLVPQKRVDLLLEAMSRLPADVELVIAGQTSHCDDHLAKLKRMAGDSGRVHFVGHVPFERLARLYALCELVVLPSECEGYANVLVEALASGCAVVTSDIEQNREVVADAGALFRCGDAEDLARVLSGLLADPHALAALRSAARKRADQLWSWDAVTDCFLELYVPDPGAGRPGTLRWTLAVETKGGPLASEAAGRLP
jgi:glycosyltransferase involved in cell wall biosynthesis